MDEGGGMGPGRFRSFCDARNGYQVRCTCHKVYVEGQGQKGLKKEAGSRALPAGRMGLADLEMRRDYTGCMLQVCFSTRARYLAWLCPQDACAT